MFFENWQKSKIVTSDGNWTIGYVDGKAAQWEGNMSELKSGDEFEFSSGGSIFGINSQEDYRVVDGLWEEVE